MKMLFSDKGLIMRRRKQYIKKTISKYIIYNEINIKRSNSDIILLVSRKLKVLTAISELSTYIKTSIDMRDDNTKNNVEREFCESLPDLLNDYKKIKDMNFSDERYTDDFFSKIKLFMYNHKNL